MNINFNAQTALAIVRLFVPLVVAVAAVFGWTFDAELLLNIMLSAGALLAFIWSWWKNNNITDAAQEAQKLLNEIKAGE